MSAIKQRCRTLSTIGKCRFTTCAKHLISLTNEESMCLQFSPREARILIMRYERETHPEAINLCNPSDADLATMSVTKQSILCSD